MSQGFWATKGSDCLNGGEMRYRIDPKRPPQRVVDGSGVELVPNKKQAVEASTNNSPYSGMLNSNVPQWGSAPSFHSYPSHFADRCYEYEGAIAKTMGFDDKRFSLMGVDKLSLGRKVNDNPFGNESSFNLSMTHTLEDPQSALTYGGGGFRKIKVSEVKDSENYVTGSMGHAYSGENNTTLLTAPAYSKVDDNSTLTGLSYNKGEENIIPIGDTYESAFNNFVSMGQSFDKGEGIITTGQTYKETMLPGQTFNKGNNDTVYLSQTYKSGENSISAGLVHDKTPETAVTSCAFNKSDKSILSICQSYDKGESTMISFGGYDDDYEVNASERLIPNDELLMGIASALKTEAINETEFINSTADALVNAHHIAASATKSFSKKKDDHKISKKVPSNNFPPNVRSLLSTGMLDGVPVKYIAWSREKELPGVIKGSGYLCGCQLCNYAKVINAFEFERHACCKTKHPNNHIYFENGKTIYGTVQELKSTPQNMLFDVIQTITGSPINQKSFRLWKESFLAATRELQRIYGSNDGKQPS